jgi:hypothetical protein
MSGATVADIKNTDARSVPMASIAQAAAPFQHEGERPSAGRAFRAARRPAGRPCPSAGASR